MDPFGFGRIIADKWDILMMSPAAFAAVLGFGFVVGLAIARIFLNERLTRQQMRIADLQAVLDGKLPANLLPSAQRKRGKLMSVGLFLIFFGIAAVLIGGLIISFERPAPSSADKWKVVGTTDNPPPADNPYIRWNKAPEIGGSTGSDNIISVTEMGQTGVSEATKEFELQAAYLVSKNTGARLTLSASTQQGMLPLSQLNNIPPNASLTLRVPIEPRIPEQQFLRDWGNYDLVYMIDGKEFRRPVTEAEVMAAFNEHRTQLDRIRGVTQGPRVTKRN